MKYILLTSLCIYFKESKQNNNYNYEGESYEIHNSQNEYTKKPKQNNDYENHDIHNLPNEYTKEVKQNNDNEYKRASYKIHNLLNEWIKKNKKINHFRLTKEQTKKYGLKIIYNENNKLLFRDTQKNLLYKTYIFDEESYLENGDDYAKYIQNQHVCPIYDITDFTILNIKKQREYFVKIVAMLLLDGDVFSEGFVMNILENKNWRKICKNEYEIYTKFIKPELQKFMLHLVLAVSKFHEHNILLNDIKEENMMYKITGNKKKYVMIDFEGADDIDNPFNNGSRLYTPGYNEPEIFTKTKLSLKSDIWAIGMTGYYLIVGKRYCSSQPYEKDGYEYFCHNSNFLIERLQVCKDTKDFLKACLRLTVEKRPTAKELLEFDFLKSAKFY
ncbi:Calcium/calmodulin-dependent protein kinase type I [Conglomerata obtusa]